MAEAHPAQPLAEAAVRQARLAKEIKAVRYPLPVARTSRTAVGVAEVILNRAEFRR